MDDSDTTDTADRQFQTPWGSVLVGSHYGGVHAYVVIGELGGDGEHVRGLGDTRGLLVWTGSLVSETKALATKARTYTDMYGLLVAGSLDNNPNLPPKPWRSELVDE